MVPGGHGLRTVITARSIFTEPSGSTSASGERGVGPASLSVRSNATSRASTGTLVIDSSIEALTTALTSSADAGVVPSASAARAARASKPFTIPCLQGSIINDHGVQRITLELLPPVQEGQLDQERDADHAATELLDETQGGRHGPAGGEEIVDREHALARADRVLVNG